MVITIGLGRAQVSRIRREGLSVGGLQCYFVVKIVVRAGQALHKILEGMLAKPPLVLDQKLVRCARRQATRPLVIDGGLN